MRILAVVVLSTLLLPTAGAGHEAGSLGAVVCPPLEPVPPVHATLCGQGSIAANRPPTADFSLAPLGGRVFAFTDNSSDTDGTVVAWAWDFGDGAASNATSPNHTYAAPGAFQVTLTVTDDHGAQGNRTLVVQAVNRPPVLDPVPSPTVAVGASVSFRLVAVDPDGDPVAFATGPLPAGAAFDHATGTFQWTATGPGVHPLLFHADDPWNRTSGSGNVTVVPTGGSGGGSGGTGGNGGTGGGHGGTGGSGGGSGGSGGTGGNGSGTSGNGGGSGGAGGSGGTGGATGGDADHDGAPDAHDNCPNVPNAGQADADGDGTGDACDADYVPPSPEDAAAPAAEDPAPAPAEDAPVPGARRREVPVFEEPVQEAGPVDDGPEGGWTSSETRRLGLTLPLLAALAVGLLLAAGTLLVRRARR